MIVRNNFVKSTALSLEREQNADKAEQENLKKIENLRQFQQIFIKPSYRINFFYKTNLLNVVVRFGFATTITKTPSPPGYLAVRPERSRFRFVSISNSFGTPNWVKGWGEVIC